MADGNGSRLLVAEDDKGVRDALDRALRFEGYRVDLATDGAHALELAPRVAEVHSVDISQEMIRIGERKAADAGVENIHVEERNAELSSVIVTVSVKDRQSLARAIRRLRAIASVTSINRVSA